jgi:hypothetical protein
MKKNTKVTKTRKVKKIQIERGALMSVQAGLLGGARGALEGITNMTNGGGREVDVESVNELAFACDSLVEAVDDIQSLLRYGKTEPPFRVEIG